jgi:hypothetical protein
MRNDNGRLAWRISERAGCALPTIYGSARCRVNFRNDLNLKEKFPGERLSRRTLSASKDLGRADLFKALLLERGCKRGALCRF